MKTLRLVINPNDPEQAEAHLRTAAKILQAGGLVAFPTETVYGLGGHALDPAAVVKIFEAKQRPSWDPLIVHVSHESMLHGVAREIPERVRGAIVRFWPGPLTLLVERNPRLPSAVTAGRSKVAVRMPAHPIAAGLIAHAGLPVAAPSANLFGRPSPTTADHVLADLDGRIDAVLDAGETQVGVESTVADLMAEPPVIYRAGAVSQKQLRELFPGIKYYEPPAEQTSAPEALPSPGTAIRHYAPRAKLVLVEPGALLERIRAFAGQKVGMMLPGELRPAGELEGVEIYPWGSLQVPETLAHNLFAGLRWLDEQKVDVIVCPIPPGDDGLFPAIRDRLNKAAR
jgi:L-threonylcarbamoyladenylate synthase